MNIENAKLDIINWIKRTNSEQLIYTLEDLRLKEQNFDVGLTEDQKKEIINGISTLEEE